MAKLEKLSRGSLRTYSLGAIASQISESSTDADRYDAALAAVAYLSELESEGTNPEDQQMSKVVDSVTGNLLSPRARLDQQTPTLVAEVGLACLHMISSKWSYSLDESSLLTVAAYTDSRDPWTTLKVSEVASSLLEAELKNTKKADFIAGPLLQAFLRPLFAKSSTRVTASGRPSHYQTPIDQQGHFSEIPVWKEQIPWAVSTFRWAVKASESSLIQRHWPLFMPVLLAFAEDDEPKVKSRGLEILALFVGICPVQVLQTTGIGTIFEEVTFPTLLHLPSITPEDESIQLLVPAYEVLIKLAEARQGLQDLHRRRLLNKLLRDGVFTGYHHASQHASISRILMQFTAKIINCMGIYSVQHLQNLLSMLSSTMTDPFALAHPPAVLAAAQALNTVIANCWPRLQVQDSGHIEHIMRIIALCWLSLQDNDATAYLSKTDVDSISEELMRSSKMLQSLWKEKNAHPPERVAEILEQEPRLASLFPSVSG
ncbi:Fc.00g086020.m01.CDS01 [Cosmosporella sp. VM-42]